jgi:hypothetical protein
VRAPAAGVVTLSGKGLAGKKLAFDAAKTVNVRLALAKSGVAALRKAKRKLTLGMRAAFSPAPGASAGGEAVTASSASAHLIFKAL